MTELAYGSPPVSAPDASLLGKWWRTVDKVSLGALVSLLLIGLLISFAASVPLAERNDLPPFYFVNRHAFFAVVSFGVILGVSTLSPLQVRRNGVRLFLVAFAAVALLPVFGTDFGKGAVRWYSVGISLQPSEFVKPGLAVLTGWMMAASEKDNGPPGVSLSFLVILMVIASLAIQPDFGQALLAAAMWGVMFFVWGAPIWLVCGLMGLGVGLIWFAYTNFEYVANRIDTFLGGDIDPTSQIGHATNAILNGGFFGTGAGAGTVKRTLPDAHTDFVMAVAAEEYGLIFCLVVISLFLLVVINSFRRLSRERDCSTRIAGVGLAAVFAVQAFVNIGVTFTLLPAKGMTLPFISYGGSSMIASAIGMGFLLALTRERPQDHVTDRIGGGI